MKAAPYALLPSSHVHSLISFWPPLAMTAPSSESAELEGAHAKVAELLDGARARAVAHGANKLVRQRCVECAAHMAL